MSLLIFDTICLNRKRMIVILIAINGAMAWLATQFSRSNAEPINMGEFFYLYFLVFSVLLIIFGVSIYGYLPAESPIIEYLSYDEIKNYLNFMLFSGCICFVILIFNISEYEKYFTKFMYSYSTFNCLLVINILTNLILIIKVKRILNTLKN